MHKYLTKKEFKKYISAIKRIDEKEDQLIKFGFDINSKLIQNLMQLQSYNVKYLQDLMNDKYETVSWFIYENNYGKNKFEITHSKPKQQVFVIDSVDKLYDYLVNHNN